MAMLWESVCDGGGGKVWLYLQRVYEGCKDIYRTFAVGDFPVLAMIRQRWQQQQQHHKITDIEGLLSAL